MKYPPKFTRRFRIVIVMNVIFLKLKKKNIIIIKIYFYFFWLYQLSVWILTEGFGRGEPQSRTKPWFPLARIEPLEDRLAQKSIREEREELSKDMKRMAMRVQHSRIQMVRVCANRRINYLPFHSFVKLEPNL